MAGQPETESIVPILGDVVSAYNLSTRKAGTGGSLGLPGQPSLIGELQWKTLSQNPSGDLLRDAIQC